VTLFVAGLVIFFAAHSVRIFAEDWRAARIQQVGKRAWQAAYSIVSLAGFVLLIWGYRKTLQAPVDLWTPPAWAHMATAILTLPAFILVVVSNVRGTRIKAAVGHPLNLGTMIWALAHLLSNGTLGDLLLFGAFFVWTAFAFPTALARDRKAGVTYPVLGISRDLIAVAVGVVLWALFAIYLHKPLIGVPAF
jgi:uncharacterized membrane protein